MKANQSVDRKTDDRVTRGSGNVCSDLGFSRREAAELTVKAELAWQILHRIEELGLTQVQAGRRLGISRPDVSKLKNGRVTGYSTDRLIALLNALAADVDIVVRPRKQSGRRVPGLVRVRQLAGDAQTHSDRRDL
jgi:predicted XRE-type DNA-binding protein